MKTSIAARVTLVVIGVHALLLPALYFGLYYVVRNSHAEIFEQNARTFARNLAEQVESTDALESPQRATELLDLAIVHSESVYAELAVGDRSIKATLNAPNARWPGREDFAFGASGDALYCIALPVTRDGRTGRLRLVFDERPTLDQIRLAMRRTQAALAAYLAIALAAAVLFALRLSRTVSHIATVARRIASGNYVESLRLESGVKELHQLGADLENMRGELVGVNERLRAEIAERERAETRRLELERRLQHRHRLETVGTLAGGIAHEINNALLPIMLLAESAMADVPAESPAHTDLVQILASARRAKEIVAKVLRFSREAGAPKLEAMELAPVVDEALRLFRLLVPPTVEVRADTSAPLPAVQADAALAVQLVMNLCTNGYQALDGRPGVLTVSLRRQMVSTLDGRVTAGDYVVLAVRDTGHGMDAATIERIFEPFFTTREVGSGTGLGLAVVHGIAESFAATITVESEPGHGSRFSVWFPVVPETTEQRRTIPENGVLR